MVDTFSYSKLFLRDKFQAPQETIFIQIYSPILIRIRNIIPILKYIDLHKDVRMDLDKIGFASGRREQF